MAVTIDNLEIEISASSAAAVRGLDAVTGALRTMKPATEGGINSLTRLTRGFSTASNNVLSKLGRITAAAFVIKRAGNTIGGFIEKSNAYQENLNLFTVSMGRATESALKYANAVEDVLGIDPSEWIRYQAVFQNMSTGFGIAAEKATIMSRNLTQMGYDLGSVFNVKFDTAMEKLESALSGQPRPMREWGFDLSEATLKSVALSKGIQKNIETMTQAEKAQLRYIYLWETMNKQGLTGDFARSLEAPANQLRVLQNQAKVAARELGNIFIPFLNFALPYAVAIIKVIRMVAASIASLFGFELTDIDYSGLEGVSVGAGDAGDALDDASEAAKKLKDQLAGFDEINIIQSQSDGSGGSGSGGNGSSFDLDLPDTSDWLNEAVASRVDSIISSIKTFWADWSPSVMAFLSGIAGYAITTTILGWISALERLTPGGKIALGIGSCVAGFVGISEAIRNITTGTGDLGANIGQAIGWFAQMETVMFALFGWKGALVGLGVAAVASLVGVLRGLNNNRINAIQREFKDLYGDISLTQQEAAELADYLLKNEFSTNINISMDSFYSANRRLMTLRGSLIALEKTLWKFHVMPDVTSGDKDAVLEQVKTIVSEMDGWIKDSGYGIVVALKTANELNTEGCDTAIKSFLDTDRSIILPLATDNTIDVTGLTNAISDYDSSLYALTVSLQSDTSIDMTGINTAKSEYNEARESLLLLLNTDEEIDMKGLGNAISAYNDKKSALDILLRTVSNIDMLGLSVALKNYDIAKAHIDILLNTDDAIDLTGMKDAIGEYDSSLHSLIVLLKTDSSIDMSGVTSALTAYNEARESLLILANTDGSIDMTGLNAAVSDYNTAKRRLDIELETASVFGMTGLQTAMDNYNANRAVLEVELNTSSALNTAGLDEAVEAYNGAPRSVDVSAHLKFIDTVESVIASNSQYVRSIGDKLSAHIEGAFADDYFSFDEYKVAADLQGKLQAVNDIMAEAEAQAGFQQIKIKWSLADLTMESTTALFSELKAQADELKAAAEETLNGTLKNLYAQIEIAELKIEDTDNPALKAQYQSEVDLLRGNLQDELDAATVAYNTKVAEIDMQVSDLALQTATDRLSGTVGKYASENISFTLNAANWEFGDTEITPAEISGFQQHVGNLYTAYTDYAGAQFAQLPDTVRDNLTALVEAGALAAADDLKTASSLYAAGDVVPQALIDRINTSESMAALKGEADSFLYTMGREMTASSAFYELLTTMGYGADEIGGAFGLGFLNNIEIFKGDLGDWFVRFNDGVVSDLDLTNKTLMNNLEAMGFNIESLHFEAPKIETGNLKSSVKDATKATAGLAKSTATNVESTLDALRALTSTNFTAHTNGLGLSFSGFIGRLRSIVTSIFSFEQGGFPTAGQLFIARESGPELVGSMGNRTTVANNDQIVEGISIGVAAANEESNRLLREQNAYLKALYEKDTGVVISPSAALGKVAKRSLAMYAQTAGG